MDTLPTVSGNPAGPPLWAPPAIPAPTTQPVRRRWRRIVVTSAALAAVVEGGAGYVGATLAGHDSASPTATAVTPLAYTAPMIDVAAVIKKVEPSVVTINTQITVGQGRRSYSGEAAGTGIVLTADGEILTNAHVVADATSITVTLDGETTARQAVLIGTDTANDVALIKIVGASGLTPATIGNSDSVAVGEDVVAIGNALDLDGGVSVTRGIISALDRSIEVESGQLTGLIQTDAAISSGNSGGPLVNSANHAMEIVAQLQAAA